MNQQSHTVFNFTCTSQSGLGVLPIDEGPAGFVNIDQSYQFDGVDGMAAGGVVVELGVCDVTVLETKAE